MWVEGRENILITTLPFRLLGRLLLPRRPFEVQLQGTSPPALTGGAEEVSKGRVPGDVQCLRLARETAEWGAREGVGVMVMRINATKDPFNAAEDSGHLPSSLHSPSLCPRSPVDPETALRLLLVGGTIGGL